MAAKSLLLFSLLTLCLFQCHYLLLAGRLSIAVRVRAINTITHRHVNPTTVAIPPLVRRKDSIFLFIYVHTLMQRSANTTISAVMAATAPLQPLGYWQPPTTPSDVSAATTRTPDRDRLVHQLLSAGCALESVVQLPGTVLVVPVGIAHFLTCVPSSDLIRSHLGVTRGSGVIPFAGSATSAPAVVGNSIPPPSQWPHQHLSTRQLVDFEILFRRRIIQPGTPAVGLNATAAAAAASQSTAREATPFLRCDHDYFAELLAHVWQTFSPRSNSSSTPPICSVPAARVEFNFTLAQSAPLLDSLCAAQRRQQLSTTIDLVPSLFDSVEKSTSWSVLLLNASDDGVDTARYHRAVVAFDSVRTNWPLDTTADNDELFVPKSAALCRWFEKHPPELAVRYDIGVTGSYSQVRI